MEAPWRPFEGNGPVPDADLEPFEGMAVPFGGDGAVQFVSARTYASMEPLQEPHPAQGAEPFQDVAEISQDAAEPFQGAEPVPDADDAEDADDADPDRAVHFEYLEPLQGAEPFQGAEPSRMSMRRRRREAMRRRRNVDEHPEFDDLAWWYDFSSHQTRHFAFEGLGSEIMMWDIMMSDNSTEFPGQSPVDKYKKNEFDSLSMFNVSDFD